MPQLSSQNTHWFEKIDLSQIKYRRIYFTLWENLNTDLMSFLIGPRRVGKSVILKQLLVNLIEQKNIEPTQILYWEFSPSDTQNDLKELLNEYFETIKKPKTLSYLLLDEIQYIKNWEEVIKLIYDQKSDVKIVLTGSLSLSFKRRMQESLAGRFLPCYIYQLDFREYLDFTDNPVLDKLEEKSLVLQNQLALHLQPEFNYFLKSGRYPATLKLSPTQTREYIASIEYQTISQDTLNYFNIEKINVFQSIFNYYKINSGNEVSFQKLASIIGHTSSETIAKYTDILELLRLIYIVPNSDNPLKAVNSNKKIYTNSAFTLNLDIVHDSQNLGLAVESYFLELLLQKYNQISYFRQRQKEIDFIAWKGLSKDGINYTGEAFEVKYQNQIDLNRDTKNLVEISKKLNLKPSVITRNLLSSESGIECIPISLL